MLKQVWICECDICMHKERAKIKQGCYNDEKVTLPDGWKYGRNQDIHLCPDCAKKLEANS